jgi:hypothetical protein
MEIFRVTTSKSLYDKTDKKIQKWSKTVGALIVLIGAVASVSTWVSNQFQNVIATQIAGLRAEVQALDKRTDQQITRLELANLIHNQPHNKAEIEKVARYYFVKLDGDWYMTGLYSAWAKEYDGDVSFIIGKE